MRLFGEMIKYQNNFPYENRAGAASITMYKDMEEYKRAFHYGSKMPAKALGYLAKVPLLFSSKFKSDIAELNMGVGQVKQANETFHFYLSNEWVFDNANSVKLEKFLNQTSA